MPTDEWKWPMIEIPPKDRAFIEWREEVSKWILRNGVGPFPKLRRPEANDEPD